MQKFWASIKMSLAEFVIMYNSFVSYILKKIQDWEQILGINTTAKQIGKQDTNIKGKKLELFFDSNNLSSYDVVVDIRDLNTNTSSVNVLSYQDGRSLLHSDVFVTNSLVVLPTTISIDASTNTNVIINMNDYGYPGHIIIDVINQTSDITITLSEDTGQRPTYVSGFVTILTVYSDTDQYSITLSIDPSLASSQNVTIVGTNMFQVSTSKYVYSRLLMLYNDNIFYFLRQI